MIAVIFEVWPAEGERQHYLDLAAALRSDLEGMDGFISVERFQSLINPDKLLSLSFWRDEEAVRAWRNRPPHRATQAKGRANYEFARRERFILKEDRIFLRLASAPHAPPPPVRP